MASDDIETVQSSRRASQSTQFSDSPEQQQQHHERPTSALRNTNTFRSVRDNPPAIRLRRVRSSRPESIVSDSGGEQPQQQQHPLQTLSQQQLQQPEQEVPESQSQQQIGRRRSSSEPHRRWYASDVPDGGRPGIAPMPSVPEMSHSGRARSQSHNVQAADFQPFQPEHGQDGTGPARPRLLRRMTNMMPGRRQDQDGEDEYDADIVDILDVVDPEVATLSSITNVQNSLFVPSFGRFVNRQPTYRLTQIPRMPGSYPSRESLASRRASSGTEGPATPGDVRPTLERVPSTMTERFYAVRPHHASLENWTEDEIVELNDHVRHMLHSRRNKMKRRFKAFGQYVRRPLGFLVTLYASLITLFGLAWVLFLIGWIYVGDQQPYVINVIDTVLVSLFAVVGDGLIPWRIVDTYHMCYIAHYHHLTWKLRQKMELPGLQDKNDLPSEPAARGSEELAVDLEAQRALHEKEELTVLSAEQQRKLEHHQAKFSKSHTFYKPHETETHYAFPLRLLVAIVVLLDFHSIFQLGLGLSTWCIDYRVRPMALTATLLSFSISVNIIAGVLISIGDRRTRKRDVIERMFRQELTREAMKRVNKAKAKEAMSEEEARQQQQQEEEKEGEQQENQQQQQPRQARPIPKPRLERIDEGKESTRPSRDFPFRPRIDQLLRRSSDRGRASGDASSSRKSSDRAGRFDLAPVMTGGSGERHVPSSHSSSSSGSSSRRGKKDKDKEKEKKDKIKEEREKENEPPPIPAVGAFPEEK